METPDAQTTISRSPPEQHEPDLKKTKTSSDTQTTTLDNTNENQKRYRRRKVAIFFGYCGVGYQGMQKNPGAKTIEGEFEEALYRSGAVPDEERGAPRRYDWSRSARTDKGVSAVGQVVSGRFFVDPPGFVERLNGVLPDQIRIFGFKRTTPTFNAKKFCDRRRYVYLIPVFALVPSYCRDSSSEMKNAVVGLGDCVDVSGGVSGSGIKSEGKDDTVSIDGNGGGEEELNSELGSVVCHLGNENITSELESEVKEEIKNGLVDEGMVKVAHETMCVQNEGSDTIIREAVKKEDDVNGEESAVKKEEFAYGEQEKERFNRILKYYVGTHNFHNFTSRTTAEDPAAKRYIISFNANTTLTVEGIEFVKCEVVGQSFMLHQIRKMIGLAVAVMRNCAPESLIEAAFRKDVHVNVPMAPEVGLYLDECLFTSYNQKWKKTHEELSMKDYEKEAEDFKLKYIYSHIASMEHKEGVVALWLQYMTNRDYPDLRFTESRETVEVNDNTRKATDGDISEENGAGEEKMALDIVEEKCGKEDKMAGKVTEEKCAVEGKMTGDNPKDVTAQEKMN